MPDASDHAGPPSGHHEVRKFTDHTDPRTWHSLLLRAICGIQATDYGHARAYLDFVRLHRGEGQVQSAREGLTYYSKTRAFEDAGAQLDEMENPRPVVVAAVPKKRRK